MLCLDDDRGAQWLAIGLGGLGVVGLGAGFALFGSVLPGLLIIAGLLVLLVLLVPRVGRTPHRFRVSAMTWGLDEGPATPWPAVDAIRADGPWLVLGPTRLALHGEDPAIREALLTYVRAVAAQSD